MKSFLEYVAEDILNKYGTDLSRIAIVFPNKRASLFLNEYLAVTARQPIWSPSYITISDLFRQSSNLTVGDPIKLVCEIHKSFKECTGIDESLDHFYGWGELLLADFDDIDKHLADVSKVFANVKDIHELDDVSYLTPEQKAILCKFFSNMTENHESELRKRFLDLWSHLEDIYNNFKERLRKQNIAYEGMLYREVATEKNFDCDKYDVYIFIGFNVIQKAEQEIFFYLQEKGKARFYWDFDDYYMRKNNERFESNEAGNYISRYLTHFPNELDSTNNEIYSNFNKDKDITYISAKTNHIQARYISDWLLEHDRYKYGKRTAIVLCDESLLPIVIHCLPKEVEKINITTGFPLFQTPISALAITLLDLQINGIFPKKNGFRANYIKKTLSHPYAQYISEGCNNLLNHLKTSKTYFFSVSHYRASDDNLRTLFDIKSNNEDLAKWILDILKLIAINSAGKEKDPLFQESLFRMYTLFNRIIELIRSRDLVVDVKTFQKLIFQLINSTTVPFHGEPAEGVQIMGVLETRNLDFDHILVLSCNDGNMPKGVNDSSFIPYSIRKAYGLTTIDNKVAIYSYYFHSLLQRASDITITYNSSTENVRTNEMSRFMLQLMVESRFKIKRYSLQSGVQQIFSTPNEIRKDSFIMNALNGMKYVSPTAINRYMRCPLQFYYNNIARIKEFDDEEKVIDNRAFGNIFHDASDLIYKRYCDESKTILESDIKYILTHRDLIENAVDTAFKKELFGEEKVNNSSWNYDGMQLINREVIMEYLTRLLKIDSELTPFRIIKSEGDVRQDITISTSEGEKMICIGGRIDRMDQVNDKENNCEKIRIIDYKTGGSLPQKINTIEEIFNMPIAPKKHADYFLQTMLYSAIVRNNREYNKNNLPVSPALLFIQHTVGENYDPIISIGKNKVNDIKEYENEFMSRLKNILSEIFEPNKSFYPTEDKSICTSCPYYNKLCGI